MDVVIVDLGGNAALIKEAFEQRDCNVTTYSAQLPLKTLLDAITKEKAKLLIIGPGPGSPEQAGSAVDLIRHYAGKVPILGIGLGQHCIVEAFEGAVSRSNYAAHGIIHTITPDGQTLFKSMPEHFEAGSFYSLEAIDVPYSFEVSCRNEHDVVMGVRHKDCAVEGVLFHPESILTPSGNLFFDAVVNWAKRK